VKFSKFVKIFLIAILIIAFFIIFGELFGSYQTQSNYVKNETRTKNNNYPFGYNIFFDEYIIKYPINVTIIKVMNQSFKVGISSDTDKLNFGKLPLYFSERKNIKINNPTTKPIEIKLKSYGNITEFIHYPDKLIVNSKTSKLVTIMLNATKLGYYDGELDVIVRSPRYNFLGGIIKWL